MDFIFTIVLLVIAFYVIWSAIRGEGKLFSTEYIYEEKIPEFKKILRILYGCMGFVMLCMALLTGIQTVLYKDTAFTLNDQFETDYAEYIAEDGTLNIEGLETYNVNDAYPTATMSTILQGLPDLSIEEETEQKTTPVYYEEVGKLSMGETKVGENETFASWKEVLTNKTIGILTWICMGLTVVGIVILFIVIRKYTNKEKQQEATAQASGSSMPKSAFEFDENTDNE